MLLGYDNLENYYRLNFLLMEKHGYRISELEDMVPWEREVYVVILMQHLREERERALQESMTAKHMSR